MLQKCFTGGQVLNNRGKEKLLVQYSRGLWLARMIYILFAICFTFVVLSVLAWREGQGPAGMILLARAAVFAVCLYLLNKLLGRYERTIGKYYWRILFCFSAGMFLLELILALILRHGTWFDVGAIHQGAAEWVETGTFANFYEYYSYFPNNLGSMTFLYVLFKGASLVGYHDYYVVASLATCVMLVVMMSVVSLICKKLSGVKSAVLALAVFALSAQFWFMGGAVYTDTLSMLFPVLIFYLYLLAKEKAGRGRLFLYLGMGVAAGIGSLNKITVLIMVIAVLIDVGLRREFKELVKIAAFTLGIAAAMSLALSAYMYSSHLSREEAERNNTPLLHWIMMGLKESGYYNPEDYEFTRSLEPEDRKEALLKEIGRRISERGVRGMSELLSRKSAADFGDGTYGIDDFLKIYPERNTWLHRFVLKDGEFYGAFQGYVTALHLALMLFMLFKAYQFELQNLWKRGPSPSLAMYTAILGIWLFLMSWETNCRYFSNFAPVIITCGVLGVSSVKADAEKEYRTLDP